VVLEHLGVPRSDFGAFRGWSLAIMRARAEGASQPGIAEAAGQASGEMMEYLADLADRREGAEAPQDVLSVLLEACDDEALRPEEMLMMLIHISLAGNGPTAMALGNAIATLGTHPEVQRAILDDPALIVPAVEELLRFDASTHFVARFAREDVRIGTRTIKAGQQVHAMIGAANRDPARFPEPDAFQLERPDNRHLAFGHGIHFCLGAPLARLEIQVALLAFLRAKAPFGVLGGQRAPSYQLRGYQSLLVQSHVKR
jgi:cytochrome P450